MRYHKSIRYFTVLIALLSIMATSYALLSNQGQGEYKYQSIFGVIKEITLLTALTAMVILQILAGIKVAMMMLWIVLLFNIIAIYCLYLIMKNIKQHNYLANFSQNDLKHKA